MITAPLLTDDNLSELIGLLKIDTVPSFIPVNLDSLSEKNDCFDNVHAKVQRDGGERIVGWQLWKQPFMIEAEYHAIWRSPNGELVDITPKNIAIDKIMFVEDPNNPYDGQQLDNIRLNTTNNLLVDDFIALAQAKFHLFSGGEKARMKMVSFSPNEQKILRYINGVMVGVESMLVKNGVRNTACFCSSNLKYKHCHGKDLVAYLNSIKS
ncbi:MAG: motif domain protein [Mucilaginibacter sp.]|nr:motif domain protein [Mucilaginibacter sp.]